MSVISGTVGAVLGSAAQEDAANKNLQAARETNAQNYRMFLEGRGSGGNALLPIYFGNQERQLGQDATDFYNASRSLLGTPQDQYNKYAQTIGGYQRSADASRGALEDVFNGNYSQQRLQNFQPVAQARVGAAKGQQEGIFEGLQQRINALNASNAQKGYSGTGSFAQNRMLGATIGARQQAAGALAGANLQNAQDIYGINNQGQDLKLQLMNMPFQQATQALNMQMQPISQVQQNYSRELQPFDFFRMSPGAFQAAPLPQVPVIPGAGQIALNGIGAANQQIGGYFANQSLANQYAKMYQDAAAANAVGGLSTGYGSSGWGAADYSGLA